METCYTTTESDLGIPQMIQPPQARLNGDSLRGTARIHLYRHGRSSVNLAKLDDVGEYALKGEIGGPDC
jgi:hypothetical protein